MRRNKYCRKDIPDSKSRILVIVTLCLVMLSCQKQPSDTNQPSGTKQTEPKPPDLSHCTRLEVSCARPIIEHLTEPKWLDPSFLSDTEKEFLTSLKEFAIVDKENIMKISNSLSLGKFIQDGAK